MDNQYDKGRTIFEKIPKGKSPLWGSLILSEFKQYNNEPTVIKELRNIIQSGEWEKAHKQFSKIRQLTLDNKDSKNKHYLSLAENIAKITFNEISEHGNFNFDSGFLIYGLAKKHVKSFRSVEKTDRIKGILNLFNTDTDEINFFAIETKKSGQGLINKIFNSPKIEMTELKKEFPRNCNEKEISFQNVKFNVFDKRDKTRIGFLETEYDLFYKNSKFGYYSLLWDDEMNLIDEFLVIKKENST